MNPQSVPRASLKDTLESGHANSTPILAPHDKFHHKIKARVHHHVHRLRQKPDHHKRAVAFGIALFCTAILFTVWYFYSLPRIIGMYHTNLEENKRLNLSPNIIQGFNNMYDDNMKATAVDAIQAE